MMPHDSTPEDEAARFLAILAAFDEWARPRRGRPRSRRGSLAPIRARLRQMCDAHHARRTEEGSATSAHFMPANVRYSPRYDTRVQFRWSRSHPDRAAGPSAGFGPQWGKYRGGHRRGELARASRWAATPRSRLSNPHQPSDAGFLPKLFDTASAYARFGEGHAPRDRRSMAPARGGVRQHLFWLVLTLSLALNLWLSPATSGSVFTGPPLAGKFPRREDCDDRAGDSPQSQQQQDFDVYASPCRARMQFDARLRSSRDR